MSDDPFATLPPLAQAAVRRAVANGADEPGLLSAVTADAAAATAHGHHVEAAALTALALELERDPPSWDAARLLDVLRRIRTAVERAVW